MPPTPKTTEEPRVENLRTLRRLVGRFRPVWFRAGIVLALLLLQAILEVVHPWLMAEGIDLLVSRAGGGGSLPTGFVTLLWLLGIVLVVKSLAFYASQVAAARVGQDLENRLRSDLFERVTALRFRYHDENRSGKTIARSLRDMEKARHFFREVWFGYMTIALLVACVVAVLFDTHWTYGVLAGGTFVGGMACAVFAGRRIARMDRQVSDVYDDVTTTLQENVAGARVVRAFGREREEKAKYGNRMDSFSGSWGRLERYWTGVMPWVNHLYHLCLPLVLLLGAYRISTGAGSLAEVIFVLFCCRKVHHRIRPLTRLVILGQQATASAARVFEVLDRKELIAPPERVHALPAQGGDLRLEDVHFGHGNGTAVLRGVSLHVPAGGSLGLLGPTGSGKSSLVHLLPRFYDPDEGRILLDGIDLQDLDIAELRAAVGLVFQEPFLFSGTVSANVAYGNPHVTQEEVERCVGLAAAHEFVLELPDGYDTIIGERGVSLSGGQRQRLTIARALAMNPRVLIFDDATASVDAVTERELFDGIRSAARGRTTLVISQRVTSVKWCERVAVLDGGVVTAVGDHPHLLQTSSLYREIHRHQQLTGVPQ